MQPDHDNSFRLAPLLDARGRREYMAGCVGWLLAISYFWIWWLNPARVVSPISFALVSLVLVWVTLTPLYFLVVVSGAKKPAGRLNLPIGTRVAMVVTKAPSEPFAVVAETLSAMLRQDVAHDTWLADEDPVAETLAWCAAHGVKVSTRRGEADYHRATWPRRTRCKEGNLAFFYDRFGYDNYDFVAQFDADHVPEPSYLREVLKPFADPKVGYVSAPSICDKNAASSWSARGRLYAEAMSHGPLQAGYNGGWAPLCIGSHYAVRTTALRQIGGLGPELAEDHSTTLMMNAAGWRGVHAIDAIAHGDGPSTFADLITQEFQWSRSLVTILLQYSPSYLRHLPPLLKFQFLFSQLWYPLSAIVLATMFAMPVAALIFDVNYVNAPYPLFLLHVSPISLIWIVIPWRLRAAGVNRPRDGRVFAWETLLFILARWPWFFAGSLAGLRDWATASFVDFRVTPKGRSAASPVPMRVLAPYAVISLISALTPLAIHHVGNARGYYMFTTCNALLYAALTLTIVTVHCREVGVALLGGSAKVVAPALLAALLFVPPVAAAATRGAEGLEALAFGVGRVTFSEYVYAVAGAGQGRVGVRRIRFAIHWAREDPTRSDK